MKNDDGKPLFNNPFAALKGSTPPPETEGVNLPERKKAPEPERRSEPERAAAGGKTKIGRAVIRLERTGRGGKEVTIVERVGASSGEREQILKKLKAALGCGGTIEGDAIVLQGDQRERVRAFLTS